MTTELGITIDPSKAAKNPMSAITGFEGDLVSVERTPASTFGKEQAKFSFENVVIHTMEAGVPEPQLKDGKYGIWITFAKPGEMPSDNSYWFKVLAPSAAKAGVRIPPIPDAPQRVYLVKKKSDWSFEMDGKKIEPIGWQFTTKDGTGQVAVNMDEYVKKLIIGCNKSTALRVLTLDNKAKAYPKYRDAVNDGSITELLGLVVKEDGTFQVL